MRDSYESFASELSKFTAPVFILPSLDSNIDQIIANGTLTLIDTGRAKVWVTCRHVWECFHEEQKRNPDAVICAYLGREFGGFCFKKLEVLDESKALDLVIFYPPIETTGTKSDRIYFRIPRWPISRIRVGETITVLGYPGCCRQRIGNVYEFGFSFVGYRVSSVSERHFALANEGQNRTYLFNDSDSKEPLSMAGMSGGPAFAFRPGWVELVGLLYEGFDSHNSLFLSHALFLRENGTLDHAKIPPA